MPIRRLADFIKRCRLTRCEEEYDTVETLELGPREQICYARLLCSGQAVRFRVCASANVTASIGLDGTGSDMEFLPVLWQNDESGIAMDIEANRSAWYMLRIANKSSVPIDCTVEIHAAKRPDSARTKFEAAVNLILDLTSRHERLHYVVPNPPKCPQARESVRAEHFRKTGRA
jgi:hypothetical protein